MKNRLFIILIFLVGSITSQAQNGKILSRTPFNLHSYDTLMARIATKQKGEWALKPKYNYINEVTLEEIFYQSDGLKVKAYLATPKTTSKGGNPVIIYNRGGNREFGSLNEYKMVFILARVASWGYTVVASQYRGTDGGDGMEEFGGADVNDILNLFPLIESLPNADATKIGMYGWSRGGMMTYLTLMKTDRIKAAVVGGALSDLQLMDDSRGGEMGVYVFSELIPGYATDKERVIKERSAVFHADKLCKTTPILLLHGTADWRVVPESSLKMALALQKAKVPYRLVMFEGGDHGLNEYDNEVDEMVKAWFQKYLVYEAPLPNLTPHGK